MTCEVVQYTNGFSLVEDFKTGKINADVIVLDIEMPEYSGVQAIKRHKKKLIKNSCNVYFKH